MEVRDACIGLQNHSTRGFLADDTDSLAMDLYFDLPSVGLTSVV